MDPDSERRLIERLLVLLKDRTTDMIDSESTLPVERYVDPDWLRGEESRLFRRLPLVLGHASQLAAPGDFLTYDAAGAPLLLLRDGDGVLRGFLNVCRHRGTRLVNEASGHGRKAITCPYHGWSYGADGRLLHVPHAEGFPSLKQADGAQVGLVPIAVVEQAGLILASAAVDSPPDVAGWLAPIGADLAALRIAEHVVYRSETFHRALNWKIAIEIFLEGYHLKYAHRDSIYPLFFDNVSISESFAPHYRGVFPKRSFRDLAGVEPSQRALRPHANILYGLFPNTLLLVQPDHLSMVSMFPDGTDRTELRVATLVPTAPATDRERAYWDKNIAVLMGAISEDLAMGEGIQRGIRSGANRHFRLARFEHGLRYFHDALTAALAG